MESPLTNHRTTRRKSPVEGTFTYNEVAYTLCLPYCCISAVITLTKNIIVLGLSRCNCT